MKILDNGTIRDMTSEEEEEFVRLQQEQPPEQPPTIDQRVSDLEEAFNMILSGVTE